MKKILIAEDDTSTVIMLRLLLSKSGFDVSVEENGLKVIGLVKKVRPDLILLDGQLPGMDGYVIQKKLFQDKDTRRIPIIMMTAYPQNSKLGKAQENVVGFIAKPFNITELQQKITEVTGVSGGKI